MTAPRRLAAILAADIAGYSALMCADDAGTVAQLKAHQAAVLPLIAAHGGRVIDTAGDGILAEFGSAVNAVNCAISIQKTMAERNASTDSVRRMQFRIGVNLGDVIYDDARVYGDGVNVAARLEGLAEPGGICVSDKVHQETRGKIDATSQDLGLQTLKNIAEPIRVHRILAGNDAGDAGTFQPSRRGPGEPASKTSIAVLSFSNMSGDVEQEYFADGIAEDIITALSKISQLFVIARNSSFTFKGRAVHVQEVSKSLGVRYVLEGSVRKSGAKVRITAQLIDGVTGGHVWAERFDRDLTDIFAVQDEVTQQIVSALALNLTKGEKNQLASAHTNNVEAYDCFLRGREQLWARQTKEQNARAQELLQHAVELDPTLAIAHAFLAATHMLDYMNGWSASPSRSLERGHEVASQAVKLDDSSPDAHWVLASIYLWMRRHDEAIREAERAISLNPNFASAHMTLGLVLHYSGKSEEALGCFNRGMALDPYYLDIYLHFQAQAHFQLSRYETAIGILRRRLNRNPNTDISRVLLAASYGHMRRIDEARAEWREVFRVNPDYSLEYRRNVLPYKNPADFEKIVDGLRKAGLVE